METFYFTGFSGTGKSMIGKMLASRKELLFLDIDKLIVEKENKTINEIFRINGEEYFRNLESNILKNDIKQGMIVSLGGGTANSIDNRHIIKKSGRVIYLKASANTICKNLEKEFIDRPLLKDNFSAFTVEKMLDERKQYYEELANYTIDIDNKSIDMIFKETLAIYNLANKVKCHIYIK